MDIKIDFGSVGKFLLSLGLLCIIFNFALAYFIYRLPNTFNWTSFSLLLLSFFSSLLIFGMGLFQFNKESEMQNAYNLEIKIRNILEQDLKIFELKLKALEYNTKIEEYNKTHKRGTMDTCQPRQFDSIARQAINAKYYDRFK